MARIAIGHINPDTDTVCSPIAYSWLQTEKLGTPTTPKIAGKINKETSFVLQKFGITTPNILTKFSPEDEIAILDTNNPEELLEGIDEAKIVEIVDHHKLIGGLKTSDPVKVTMRPLACTATIVWQMMKEAGATPTKEIAGIMLCAILSDTLKFTSPTTTDIDKEAAGELVKICEENMDDLANAMFEAKSDLSGMSSNDILKVDSKIFDMGTKKARISVLESTKPQNALNMYDDLITEMTKIKNSDGVDYVFFFVVDILKSESTLLVTNDHEKEIASQAFGQKFEDKTMVLPGVVSRKKQIVPKFEAVIK